jgi:hypothetical protein
MVFGLLLSNAAGNRPFFPFVDDSSRNIDMVAVPGNDCKLHPRNRNSTEDGNENGDGDEHGTHAGHAAMYGRLLPLHDHVHGNDDALHDQEHGHADDEHASGLRRYVPDGDALHDALFDHVAAHVWYVR